MGTTEGTRRDRIVRSFAMLLCGGIALFASLDATSGMRITSDATGFGQAGDQMGAAVAVHGDTAIAGSPDALPVGNLQTGAAQIFRNDGTGWHLEAVLAPSDGMYGQSYGSGVAIGQDIAVVGVSTAGPSHSYTYVRSGTTWTQTDELTDGGQPSLSGDTLSLSTGSVARIFVRTSGAWIRQADLQGDLPATQEFVFDAHVAGDFAAIATYVALTRTPSESLYAISEYFFSRSNGTWTRETKLDLGQTLKLPIAPAVALSSDGTAVIADGGFVQAYVRDNGAWSLQGALDPGFQWDDTPSALSVAVDGDTAVVGSLNDVVLGVVQAGSAYVFTRTGTSWARTARPYDPDSVQSAAFGTSVALDGTTLVVGAPGGFSDDIASGKMDVFDLSGDPSMPVATFGEGNAHANERFGASMAASGTTLLVAAPNANLDYFSNSTYGAAYVFEQADGTWQQSAELKATSSYGQFGSAVALDGTTAAVGSIDDNVGNPDESGAVYVYTETGGAWQQQQRISSGLIAPNFGSALGLVGDTLAVGDPGSGSQEPSGRVRIFARSGATWSDAQTLQPVESGDNDGFGVVLAMSADTMIVGAPGANVGIESSAGAAYVFVWNGTDWLEQAQLLAPMPLQGTNFGRAVALAGDTAMIAASSPTSDHRSTAYVFTRSAGAWSLQATLEPSGPNETFGAVALSSDASIALLGVAPATTNAAGAAYAYQVSGGSWTPIAMLQGSQAQQARQDLFGSSAIFLGDTAFIGAPGEVVGGAVYADPLADAIFADGFD